MIDKLFIILMSMRTRENKRNVLAFGEKMRSISRFVPTVSLLCLYSDFVIENKNLVVVV